MLGSVIANYLDTLDEREFDAPFMSLLRALGFVDIHFLHGKYEFGKDFIAKRAESGKVYQYTFQSKAGDISQSDWREVRGQLDELRTNCLAHANFDKTLERKAIFLLTGRLVGGATLASQDYADFVKKSKETGFEIWDRETLLEIYLSDPVRLGTLITGGADLLLIFGLINEGTITAQLLEEHSRRWLAERFGSREGGYALLLEASLIAHSLSRSDRSELAAKVFLLALRAIWFHSYEEPLPLPDWRLEHISLAQDSFAFYADRIKSWFTPETLAKRGLFLGTRISPASLVTYPVRCLQVIESLGLLGLLQRQKGDFEESKRTSELLVTVLKLNPGCEHPISDKYAVCLVPPALLLAKEGLADLVRSWLSKVIVWTCDRYEEEHWGLADVDSSAEEEVRFLLGSPYSFIEQNRRRESYIASVVIDLAAILQLPDLYEVAVNDFKAVQAIPTQNMPQDSQAALTLSNEGADLILNPDYSDVWKPKGSWKQSPHHSAAPESYAPIRAGSPWAMVAIGSILRDRHFLAAMAAVR